MLSWSAHIALCASTVAATFWGLGARLCFLDTPKLHSTVFSINEMVFWIPCHSCVSTEDPDGAMAASVLQMQVSRVDLRIH